MYLKVVPIALMLAAHQPRRPGWMYLIFEELFREIHGIPPIVRVSSLDTDPCEVSLFGDAGKCSKKDIMAITPQTNGKQTAQSPLLIWVCPIQTNLSPENNKRTQTDLDGALHEPMRSSSRRKTKKAKNVPPLGIGRGS